MPLLCVLGPAGARADDTIPPRVETRTPSGINLADGTYSEENVDVSIADLQFERYFASLGTPIGGPTPHDPLRMAFGQNSSHNFDIAAIETYVARDPGPPAIAARYRVVVHIGHTSSGIFQEASQTATAIYNGSVDSQVGSMSVSSNNYTYSYRDGTLYTFSNSVKPNYFNGGPMSGRSQRAVQIDFANGRRRTLNYNASSQLQSVIDSAGYALVLEYNASGYVSAACAYDLAQTYVNSSSTCAGAVYKATYTYNSNRLASVTNMLGQTTTYADVSGGQCITPPGYTTCRVLNHMSSTINGYGPVDQQTFADGTVWHYQTANYASGAPALDYAADPNSTTVTDPLNHASTFTFAESSPASFVDADNRPTSYTFTGATELNYPQHFTTPGVGTLMTQVTFPEGNSYQAEYYGNFNGISRQIWRAKAGSNLVDREVTYGYGNCFTAPSTLQNCGSPSWRRDANGNQIDYSYAAWGGVLTEMGPPPTTGAARPLTVRTYAQRQAYIKNSGGTLVPSATAIWMPATVTVCQTAAGSSTPTCDGAAPQRTTTYQYGATGSGEALLVKGEAVSDGTTTLRTCYGYDAQRNRVSQTAPNANLATCP